MWLQLRGCFARMVRSSIGNASLSSPPFPAAGCLSPPEAKISPAAPCWEAVQLERGAGGRAALQLRVVTGMGTPARAHQGGGASL